MCSRARAEYTAPCHHMGDLRDWKLLLGVALMPGRAIATAAGTS
jgi:hypothetical protein